jgi:hypothetical protein
MFLILDGPQTRPPVASRDFLPQETMKMRVRLDAKEIWSTKAYWSNPRAPEGPYQEAEDGTYP